MLVASKVAASCKELPTRILLPKLSIGPIVVPCWDYLVGFYK